ncbi:MAG: GH32 C-terminal domain-containing protein, partial [Lachnospiraceae bacterium]|nr:GH32 C-terminal domain-containing protein [Lachnospiraceae bacterium]
KGNWTVSRIRAFDKNKKTFSEEYNQAVDYGIDFYAPQTILAPDGRRIMIGWMQNWDTCNMRNQPKSWFGQMSLPRELSIKNGRLYQSPVRELDELRCNKVEHKDVLVNGLVRLKGVEGRLVDMELQIRPVDKAQMFQKFAVRFAQDEIHHTAISFRPMESILKVDRKFSGSRRAIIHQRRSMINHEEGKLKLRVILDRLSVEVFVNDGEQVMTATIDTPQDAGGISFFADGNVMVDVVKYDIKDIDR